jgi:hypothetical protein
MENSKELSSELEEEFNFFRKKEIKDESIFIDYVCIFFGIMFLILVFHFYDFNFNWLDFFDFTSRIKHHPYL